MIGHSLEIATSLATSHTALMDEKEASALREQFIAVLGHDLRNPLAAIQGGMRLLEKETLSDRGNKIVGLIHESVKRMAALIDNVMDFARGRLGGGIPLQVSSANIGDILAQVVAEIRSGHPDRIITTDIRAADVVACDKSRLGQLFSNLLGNAIAHGATDEPIHVASRIADGWLELDVTNGGGPIPPEVMEKLFSPFSRGEVRPSLQGLGLGLYIASQIAEAHGGTLAVRSSSRHTTFTFRMPVAA
jgi:signal transduction histidine kinase